MLVAERPLSVLDEHLDRGDELSPEVAAQLGARKIETLKNAHFLRDDTDAVLVQKVEDLEARVAKLEAKPRKKATA